MFNVEIDYYSVDALSNSGISRLLDCAARFKAWEEEGQKETPSLKFGRLFHTLTLEPEKFEDEYAVTDLNLTTADGRKWKSSLPENKVIIKNDEYESAFLMSEAVKDHPQAKFLFQNYKAERPIFWNFRGIRCKAKPDIISLIGDMRICADLKSIDSADPRDIQMAIAKYGYHRQAAWYSMGLSEIGEPCDVFIFIFVEKQYPYLVTVCRLDEGALEAGEEECLKAVEIYRACKETNLYPCYTKEILTISLPKWASERK